MATSCDPIQLQADAKCIATCIPPGQQIPVLISLFCQILANGGGGGGSGTVTSFSAGNLSPLFTTSVTNATTTPALAFAAVAQAANLFYVGPASGAAAAPTFRAMVNADLGTTLTPQFARLGLGVAADATIPLTVLLAGVGTTPADGVLIENTTAAAAGAQQYSPALQFKGAGWKTTAVAASQSVDFQMYVLPVQGTTSPTGLLVVQSSVNGAAFSSPMYLDTSNRLALGTTPVSSQFTVLFSQTDFTNTAGANSHILLVNNSANAQIAVSAVVSGTVRGKWRTDGTGNLNWIANGGSHFFFVGGDFGTGTILMTLDSGTGRVDATTGFSTAGTPGISQTFNTLTGDTAIVFVGGLATGIA